jgi:phytoene dehydrogenase-like protein
MSEARRVVVVGAGLSGLVCARTLQRAGQEVHLYEASDGVGGRVRTDALDGFLLDRGFQVLFTAYPAIQREMNLDALQLHAFDPGALIYWNGKRHLLADPFRMPSQAFAAATSPLFGMGDKMKVARLRTLLMGKTIEEIFAMPDQTIEGYLREFGFSGDFLDNFIRPFYGGIFLERELSTSARMFAFVFKMLSEGDTALPERGMGALGTQLASDLLPGTLHLNAPVRELARRNGQVAGVVLEDGATVDADRVVIATEADMAASLTGLNLPTERRASTCLYFAVPEAFYPDKLILLFTGKHLVNNATLLTNVAPSYAPPGKHLLSVTALGNPELSDAELARQAQRELQGFLPEANPEDWHLLRVYRIHWAQFAQPVGIWERLPAPQTEHPGLILAGEITVSSSLHGALEAGARAAQLAMQ